jgi:ABC-type xylose transport system substrate-binding protein
VIDYDRLVVGNKATYYVSFDNVRVGKLMANGLADAVKANGTQKPVVSRLNGGITDNNAKLFKQGYDSVPNPLFANGTYVQAKAGDQTASRAQSSPSSRPTGRSRSRSPARTRRQPAPRVDRLGAEPLAGLGVEQVRLAGADA